MGKDSKKRKPVRCKTVTKECFLENNYPFKKGKGIYLYDIHGEKYIDLCSNDNIIGYSDKKITTVVKNHISSSWNLYGDSVYHRRLKSFFNKNISPDYSLRTSFSLIELFTRMVRYSKENSYNFITMGKNFQLWTKEFINDKYENATKHSKNIIIYDMAEIYLKTGSDSKKFATEVNKIEKKELTVFNYYWYPELEIITDKADITILPEIYSGCFKYINILVKNNLRDSEYYTNTIECIPSLYIASSMKLYHTIKKKQKDVLFSSKNPDLINAGRLFTFKNSLEDYQKMTEEFIAKKVLLNTKPPYYNYFPIILEEHQKKYLSRIGL